MKNDNILYTQKGVIIYVIIFRALSFIIAVDVIIFHVQQMLSFLLYVSIFPCTYFVLSFIVIMTFTSWKMITSSTPKKDNM